MAEPARRWLRRAQAEAASADRFEALAEVFSSLGPGLSERLCAAAADERRHAALCANVAATLGGEALDEAQPLNLPPLQGATQAARLAEEVTFLLAAGETVAIALLDLSRAPPCRADIAEVLGAIQGDERVHAALGWDLLDALTAAHPDEKDVWAQLLPRMAVFVELGSARAAPEVGAPEVGVTGRDAVARCCRDAMVAEVVPRLLQRGLWAAPAQRGGAEG